MFTPTDTFSETNDSIKRISISTHLSLNDVTGKQEVQMPDHLFFDVDVQQIFIQIEVSLSSTSDISHFLMAEIKKKSAQQFRLKPIISKKVLTHNQTVYLDSLDISDSVFASGNYDLIVSYFNDSMKTIDSKKVSFQLLRKTSKAIQDEFYSIESDKPSNHVAIEKTFVQKYGLSPLKKNILSLTPLAKGAEKKVIKELALSDDVLVLKQFFYNFWFNRNPSDPEKAWNDYVIILNDIAKKYGNASTPGYESDRGRIFIQYGEPDRIVRMTNEKNSLPYEVWFYYRSGTKTNLKFLFFQPGMLGSLMLLLHSNVTEEIVNPYWKEMLLSDPGNGDNKLTHKVFEFFN